MRRLSVVVMVPSFAFLFSWLLWPLGSDQYDISWEESAMQQKQHVLSSIKAEAEEKPNVVLIMVDDLGKMDIPLYGGNTIVKTPTIDKLAQESVVFTNAYVTSPVCSPSRAAILTGQYQQRFGFHNQMHDVYLSNRLQYYGFKFFVDSYPWKPKWMEEVPSAEAIEKQGLPPSVVTLPEILQRSGYRTGLVGKWHLGWAPENEPCNFGFDYQYGFYSSHSLYASVGSAGVVDQKVEGDFTDPYIWKGQRDGPHAIYRNCEETTEEEYLTDAIARESLEFIGQNKDEPFFLFASFNAPHTPLQATQSYFDQYPQVKDPVKRTYYAMISQLDDAVGRILSQLDSLGLAKNTLVFFISDNGGATYTKTTDNGALKGGKITDLEGGVAVPFMFRWSNTVSPATYEEMVMSLDIFPTVLAAAGITVQKHETDGADLLSYLTDSAAGQPLEAIFWEKGASRAIRTDAWKMVWHEETQDTLLYAIASDPFETKDLANQPQYQTVKKELARQFRQWSAANTPPMWPSMIYYQERIDGREFYFDN